LKKSAKYPEIAFPDENLAQIFSRIMIGRNLGRALTIEPATEATALNKNGDEEVIVGVLDVFKIAGS
jgi:hypothetical protein